MIQKRKDPHWVDEAGTKIPFNRLTKLEIMKEAEMAKILKEANHINAILIAYKRHVAAACEKIVTEFMQEKAVDRIGKGNVSLFNFDRSIRLELNVNDRITFDDLTMNACKQKFDEFLSNNIDEKQAFVKDMIQDAFSTSRGKLDAKKVMSLLKYETRINDITFQRALLLLKESIRRPDSKNYYRVSVKNKEGKYENIDLNFSSL
jgi:uncharacterized protein